MEKIVYETAAAAAAAAGAWLKIDFDDHRPQQHFTRKAFKKLNW